MAAKLILIFVQLNLIMIIIYDEYNLENILLKVKFATELSRELNVI